MKLMLEYIHGHYASELTTAAIAHSAMVSESECLRCFRRVIGLTPIQYVTQYRIQKAAELLASSDLSVAETGARCGFQDASYFFQNLPLTERAYTFRIPEKIAARKLYDGRGRQAAGNSLSSGPGAFADKTPNPGQTATEVKHYGHDKPTVQPICQ